MFETQTTRTRTRPDYSIPEPYPNPTFPKLKLLVPDPTRKFNFRLIPERFETRQAIPEPNPTREILYPTHLYHLSSYERFFKAVIQNLQF